MTLLTHLNDASEALQDALGCWLSAADRAELQSLLDRVNNLVASEEAMDRRDQAEKASR